jgi:hypothetical protein
MAKLGRVFGLLLDSVAAAAAVPAFSVDRPSCLLMASSLIIIEGGEATGDHIRSKAHLKATMDVPFLLSLTPFSFPTLFFFFGLDGDGFERRCLELEALVFGDGVGGGTAESSRSETSSLLVEACGFDLEDPVKIMFSTCSAFQ